MKLEERHCAETAREYALRMLKENIISMELKPGAMVSENELAAQLGLSRTPVREALMDMGADYSNGLSLNTPRFELHVSPLCRSSALRISVKADDAEFARSLCLSARELAEALERER